MRRRVSVYLRAPNGSDALVTILEKEDAEALLHRVWAQEMGGVEWHSLKEEIIIHLPVRSKKGG